MAYTMFSQKPCKIYSSERHNSRAQKLDYIFSDLTPKNESFYFDNRKLKDIYNECKELYEEKVKRKFQEKTAPIREGVVLIDENTTLDDVKRLAEELGELLKWKPLQVHIHRDEGHKLSPDNKKGSEVAKLNLHAHIVFDTQDKETGKMNNSGKENLSTAQDTCARVLRMERGKPSTKKHLDALNFKIKKQEERIQALSKENKELLLRNAEFQKENEKRLTEIKENKEDLQILKREIERKEQEKSKIVGELLLLRQEQEEKKKQKQTLENENQKIQQEIEKKKEDFEYLCGAGEMEDLAARFVEIARNNKDYTGMSWDDARDELHAMIDKKVDKELQQGGNTLRR